MFTEQLNQERVVANGPEGLGEELNKIYKELNENAPDSTTNPFRFIEYKRGDLASWLMVDTQTTPLKIWYYDYEFGRAADQAVRNQIKEFYWQNYGDPKLPEEQQQTAKELFFNENFKDLARGFKGEDLLVKRARDNFMTNEAVEPPPVVTKESAKSKLFILASSQSKVSTSKASLFGTPPAARRPQVEKEQEKTLESSSDYKPPSPQ